MTINLAVLLSGGGTSLQNFIDRIADGSLDARIQIVVASRRNVGGIERAQQAGLPVEVVERRKFETPEAFSDAITTVLESYPVDLIVLAGLLQKYVFPPKYNGRVMNIHPGLLPEYGGLGMYGHHVHEAVLAAGEAESGCTVHIADHEYDHGPIVLQKRVPVLPGDTADTLAARVFEAECEAYPEAIRMFAEGRLPALR